MTVIPSTSVVHFTLNSKWKLACGVELTILFSFFPSVICQTCSAICNKNGLLGFMQMKTGKWSFMYEVSVKSYLETRLPRSLKTKPALIKYPALKHNGMVGHPQSVTEQ